MEVPFTLTAKSGAVVLRGYATKGPDHQYTWDLPRLVPGDYVFSAGEDILEIKIVAKQRLTGKYVDAELEKEWRAKNAGHRTTFGPAPRTGRMPPRIGRGD